MKFVASIYPGGTRSTPTLLLSRFNLHPEQAIKVLSHGERVKAMLLLVLARRPRLLLLDEPTTGLDPVARHEVLTELMDVVRDERRAILFSSHNTQDVEQISDHITFIDRGRIIDASDKETFLDGWRRLHVDVPARRLAPPRRRRRRDEHQRPPRDRHDQGVLAGARDAVRARRRTSRATSSA